MMLRIAVLFVCLQLFFTTQVYASSEERVHLIIAMDQSSSMFSSHNPSWASVQSEILFEYFMNYNIRCQTLDVDYFAWGSFALSPVSKQVNSPDEAASFAYNMYQESQINLQATIHYAGMIKAASLVTPGYDRTVIIFMTDEGYSQKSDIQLWPVIPETAEFIGISLGDESVWSYVEFQLKPPSGLHYNAQTPKQLFEVLHYVLDELGFNRCLAS